MIHRHTASAKQGYVGDIVGALVDEIVSDTKAAAFPPLDEAGNPSPSPTAAPKEVDQVSDFGARIQALFAEFDRLDDNNLVGVEIEFSTTDAGHPVFTIKSF